MEGTCVYPWSIPIDIWQKKKKLQYCKVIILQLNKCFKLKKKFF